MNNILLLLFFFALSTASENLPPPALIENDNSVLQQQQLEIQKNNNNDVSIGIANHDRCASCLMPMPRAAGSNEKFVWCRSLCPTDSFPTDVFPRFCRVNVSQILIYLSF